MQSIHCSAVIQAPTRRHLRIPHSPRRHNRRTQHPVALEADPPSLSPAPRPAHRPTSFVVWRPGHERSTSSQAQPPGATRKGHKGLSPFQRLTTRHHTRWRTSNAYWCSPFLPPRALLAGHLAALHEVRLQRGARASASGCFRTAHPCRPTQPTVAHRDTTSASSSSRRATSRRSSLHLVCLVQDSNPCSSANTVIVGSAGTQGRACHTAPR